jgi:hypothetical protein
MRCVKYKPELNTIYHRKVNTVKCEGRRETALYVCQQTGMSSYFHFHATGYSQTLDTNLTNVVSSLIIKSMRMRWEGHIARKGEKRNACRLLVGKPEGKRPLGRKVGGWIIL